MKALKIIGNILIGIILFCLIFALTFTQSTKKFLEKDLIMGVVKDRITNTIMEESGIVTDKSKELLNEMLDDNESNNIVRMIIDNFDSYQNDKRNFKISDSDVEKIYSYATKYKSTIVQISGDKIKNISDEEFKKIFSSENINKLANEIFSSIDNNIGDGVDIVIKAYSKATSKTAIIILISSIVFFTILLLLINWSWYKWMITAGICLIASGLLIGLVYVAGAIFNDVIVSVDFIKEAIGEINLNGYLIWGLSELLIGILLIVMYGIIKSKIDNKQYKELDNELS